jgi:hypothetical protein
MLLVNAAQCDNFLEFGDFTSNVFGIDPNVCKNHILCTLFYTGISPSFVIHLQWIPDIMCPEIAAANCWHVCYIPTREEYNDFFEILLSLVDNGVDSSKNYAQKALVAYP